MAPLSAAGNTCPYACIEISASDFDMTMTIDHMEESIRDGINKSVKIVNPVYDSRVKSYLRRYIEVYPKFTEEMLGRAEIYFPLFEKYLKAYGMPTDLKYLAIVESGLRPLATSPVGAAGMWQFMRGTGKDYGLRITQYVDERRDPEKSTEAAVKYLKKLYERFGSWELAMAGYNAGPGRVNSAIRRSGTNDYWKLQNYLQRETRSYIPGFIAANYLFNHYSDHNLVPKRPHSDFLNTSMIKIYEGMSFADINTTTGVKMSTLRTLNPMYSRKYIPQSVIGYPLQLPTMAAAILVAHLGMNEEDVRKYTEATLPFVTSADITFKKRTVSETYRVRSGDNLYRIAQANACSVNDLMRWNHLSSSNLRINQRLKINVTERVAIYPDVNKRALLEVAEIRSILYSDSSPIKKFSAITVSHNVHVVKNHGNAVERGFQIPTNSVVIKRRMSVADALRLNSKNNTADISKASYKQALPGYVIVLSD
jgi:membrane-bound lytic murein transglycosylase D